MKISVENTAAWTVLTLEGELDAEAGPGMYLQFQRELLQGSTRFVLDLGGVPSVDSAGLGVLVRCYKEARARGGEIQLRAVPEAIDRILEFTRLNTILPVATLNIDAGPDLRAA